MPFDARDESPAVTKDLLRQLSSKAGRKRDLKDQQKLAYKCQRIEDATFQLSEHFRNMTKQAAIVLFSLSKTVVPYLEYQERLALEMEAQLGKRAC